MRIKKDCDKVLFLLFLLFRVEYKDEKLIEFKNVTEISSSDESLQVPESWKCPAKKCSQTFDLAIGFYSFFSFSFLSFFLSFFLLLF